MVWNVQINLKFISIVTTAHASYSLLSDQIFFSKEQSFYSVN
jgi:hypothetical protein